MYFVQFVRKLRKQASYLLDRVWFRVLLAIVIAYLSMLAFSPIEQWYKQEPLCHFQDSFWQCFCKQTLFVFEINNIEGFSIFTAATLYLLESRERRRKTIYEAWQVIDNAAGANVATSYARIKALEDLNKYGVSLKGLDVPGACLNEVSLAGADLSFADLNGVNLNYANLSGAKLNDAQLEGANLNRANLSYASFNYANLSSAQLEGANFAHSKLVHCDLSDADLSNVDFSYALFEFADLSGAQLEGAQLENACLLRADLTYANLRDASFKGAKNLTPEQIKSAFNWEEAIYDEDFHSQLGLPSQN